MKLELEDGKELVRNNITIGHWKKTDKGFVLIMPRTKDRHRNETHESYGISKSLLEILAGTLQVKELRIVVDNGKEVLTASPYTWNSKGTIRKGKGEKIHLKEEDFDNWNK